QASVVSFGNEASNPIDKFLTFDLSSIRQAIDAITITKPSNLQNTNFADGILKGGEELSSGRARGEAQKIMIALTDGVATRPTRAGSANYPEIYALEVASQIKEKGVRVFTIGLGR